MTRDAIILIVALLSIGTVFGWFLERFLGRVPRTAYYIARGAVRVVRELVGGGAILAFSEFGEDMRALAYEIAAPFRVVGATAYDAGYASYDGYAQTRAGSSPASFTNNASLSALCSKCSSSDLRPIVEQAYSNGETYRVFVCRACNQSKWLFTRSKQF